MESRVDFLLVNARSGRSGRSSSSGSGMVLELEGEDGGRLTIIKYYLFIDLKILMHSARIR